MAEIDQDLEKLRAKRLAELQAQYVSFYFKIIRQTKSHYRFAYLGGQRAKHF